MRLEQLGELTRHPDIEEWLQSELIDVGYFPEKRLRFILENIEDDEAQQDYAAAVVNFLKMTTADREVASLYVFKNYSEFVRTVGEDEIDVRIAVATDVWKHIQPSEVYVKRRRKEKKVYTAIAAECDWEPEHGLQIVYRNGNQLSRISTQDGHLSYCDAYAKPESDDRIC